ncbi:hypothetical protein MTO96_028166 [Rhipicephalus appendiculatus]
MTDEYIAHLHRRLDVLKLCVSLCKTWRSVCSSPSVKKSFIDNLPPKPTSQPSGVATQGSSLTAATAAGDRPCRQQVTAGSKHVTNFIAHLSEEEFANIPKYMKGRFMLAALNKLVDGFNKAIASKYELLALPKSRLKEAQWKRVSAYNMQETAETKRLSFVVDADLTGKGGGAAFESSRVVTQFMVVMRHCGRIREIRGPERIVRYVVV